LEGSRIVLIKKILIILHQKIAAQLEIKSGNPLKISEKGGTIEKHRRKKSSAFISN
jgi:hypothetical protein